jgi:hypothetical protein
VRRRLRVLTWHVHGTYLAALAEVPVDWYLPVRPARPHPYGGQGASFDWPDNVHEVDAAGVAALDLDCVVHQSQATWEADRLDLLTEDRFVTDWSRVLHDVTDRRVAA